MTLPEATLTSGKVIRAFWEEHAGYVHDGPESGGRRSMCAAGLDNHLIIGSTAKDFCMKWLSHDFGTHKWCIEIPEELGGRQ